MTKYLKNIGVALLMGNAIAGMAQAKRTVTDISNNNWQMRLDPAAKWQNDELFAPPVNNLAKLPVNPPTKGWGMLASKGAKTVHLPATVEEFNWGYNGNKFGSGGNYLGVSWFSTQINVPAQLKGKRVVLNFESVRFRAEIFINHKLVGYDLVNSTPFDIDITDAIKPGTNNLDVRITDPNGNFDWRDSQNFMWGDYRTQPTHGFGGITGTVKLTVTDKVFVSDVFVKNKPKVNEVDVQVTGNNELKNEVNGSYQLQVRDAKTHLMVFDKKVDAKLAPGSNEQVVTIALNNAKLWDVDHPNLYTVNVKWAGLNGTTDEVSKRFGFRWFEVKNVNGDPQFYLNNKRIVLRTSISWGFWAVNGIAPSNALARKQVQDAKRLGLNMLNFHRTIGQTNVLDAADELGLLYFEEPGGNQYPDNLMYPRNDMERKQTNYYLAVRDAKFFRMVVRDRSHPSLVIYNMHNERGALPTQIDRDQMMAGHKLDNSRIITYNSCNGAINMNGPDPKYKLHLLPYDDKFYDYGWFDQHHSGGPGTYHDALYNNPQNFAKYIDHTDEIIYYGEEGAIGAPPRLQLIRDAILKNGGANVGWESDTYLKWYDAYDSFLKKNSGFLKAFPNVDSLTRKMGNVAYYYQGRVIENVRISNNIDGYAINGWESMKQENHSGVVDDYRNLKGDPDLIAYYNQPLYLAVKLNHKVLPVGDSTTADIFIVNEKDVKGAATLNVKATDNKGQVYFQKSVSVNITGGVRYGELLAKGLKFPVTKAGYSRVSAEITRNSKIVCTGNDQIYAVKFDASGIPTDISVADTSGVIAPFLQSIGIKSFKTYRSGTPASNKMIIAGALPQQTGNPLVTDLLEWVNNGNTLIITGNNVEKWATYLAKKEVIDFRGIQVMGTTWYGGNYFVKQHPLFQGLPQSCVFNWEYQSLATYNKNRYGMRMYSGETIVGCVSDHKQDVYSALSVIHHGRGKIVLCALDVLSCIRDIKMGKKAEGDGENAAMDTFNFSSKNPANVVGQQLLLNMLKY